MVRGGGGMEGGAGRTESKRGGRRPGLRREGCAGCRSNPSPSLPALQNLGCLPCSPRLCVRASGGEKDPESAGAAAPGGPRASPGQAVLSPLGPTRTPHSHWRASSLRRAGPPGEAGGDPWSQVSARGSPPRHHVHSWLLRKGQERFSHHRVLREEGS